MGIDIDKTVEEIPDAVESLAASLRRSLDEHEWARSVYIAGVLAEVAKSTAVIAGRRASEEVQRGLFSDELMDTSSEEQKLGPFPGSSYL